VSFGFIYESITLALRDGSRSKHLSTSITTPDIALQLRSSLEMKMRTSHLIRHHNDVLSFLNLCSPQYLFP